MVFSAAFAYPAEKQVMPFHCMAVCALCPAVQRNIIVYAFQIVNAIADTADEMRMRLRVCIKAFDRKGQPNDAPLFRKLIQIAVYCTQT